MEGLSAPLNAIDFKDGYLWAVGGDGLILKSDITTDIWIDENNNKIYPTDIQSIKTTPTPSVRVQSPVGSWQSAVKSK